MESVDSQIPQVTAPTSYEELLARRESENTLYASFFQNTEVEEVSNDNEVFANYFK